MKYIYLLTLIFSLMSCSEIQPDKKGLNFNKVEKESFSKIINKKSLREGANLQEDKYLLNRDYPIEISLYEDGKWYYNLDNLGDGYGTWKYKNGRLVLFAKRVLFDMYIDIEATDKNANNFVIKFSDRFGPRILRAENLNLK